MQQHSDIPDPSGVPSFDETEGVSDENLGLEDVEDWEAGNHPGFLYRVKYVKARTGTPGILFTTKHEQGFAFGRFWLKGSTPDKTRTMLRIAKPLLDLLGLKASELTPAKINAAGAAAKGTPVMTYLRPDAERLEHGETVMEIQRIGPRQLEEGEEIPGGSEYIPTPAPGDDDIPF